MDKNKMSGIPQTPPFIERYTKVKEGIYKKAMDKDFVDGKIPAIEVACTDNIEKKVCYMVATSHEYKKPNTESSLTFVKNYDWELSNARISMIEGIDKLVDKSKVLNIAKNMRTPSPLIVVNQLNGIRPQTRGKVILVDGHHRLKAYEMQGLSEIPIYRGTYHGGDSIVMRDDIPKFPKNRRLSFAFDFDDTILSKKVIS